MLTDPNAGNRHDLVFVINPGRLAAACAARGWSYTRLARLAGLSRPTMTAILHGRTVRPRTVWKIARALNQGEAQDTVAGLVGEG